jgi:hypothetical protein
MIRTVRQQFIDRVLIRALRDCGGYLLPKQALRDTLDIACQPPLRDDEFDDALNYASAERRISVLNTATGAKFKLTENGQVWANDNRV